MKTRKTVKRKQVNNDVVSIENELARLNRKLELLKVERATLERLLKRIKEGKKAA